MPGTPTSPTRAEATGRGRLLAAQGPSCSSRKCWARSSPARKRAVQAIMPDVQEIAVGRMFDRRAASRKPAPKPLPPARPPSAKATRCESRLRSDRPAATGARLPPRRERNSISATPTLLRLRLQAREFYRKGGSGEELFAYFLSRSSLRRILPTGVLGRSVRNSITLGCLY